MVVLNSIIKKVELMTKIFNILLTIMLISLTGFLTYLFAKDNLVNIVILLPLIFGNYLIIKNLFKNE